MIFLMIRSRHAFVAKGLHFLRALWVNSYAHYKIQLPWNHAPITLKVRTQYVFMIY
jgi:hypothetical protein